MTPIILDARSAGDSADVGGKAHTLARAARSGLAVPAFCVVSEHAGNAGRCPHVMDPDLRRTIAAAIVQVSPDGCLLAVRSSANDEDGSQHSFAGQFATFLNVAPEDVPDRVFDVWQSAFSDHVAAYRRQHALGSAHLPAVILQRMLTPSASGVAFSADPVSGRRGIAVVAAVRGLGQALVAGDTDADTWRVDREGEIVERQLMASQPAGEPPVLSDTQVREIAALARRASRLFGAPQDIEWAIDGGLYLLQSRPVTSLRTTPDPDGVPAIWDNSNIVESYSGVTLPLTFSFVREIYPPVYRQFCRMMGVPASVIAQRPETFENVLGLVRGRLYYNLFNWYRILALLPGYRLNRGFMEQMMGVSEPLPDEYVERIAGEMRGSRLSDAFRLMRTLAGLVANHVTLERRVNAFYGRVNDALAPPAVPLADCRPDELVEHYGELRRRLLSTWDAPLVNDFFAMLFYGLLRRQCSAWCGDAAGALQSGLIAGGGMISAEPARLMRRLASMAASDPTLVRALQTGNIDDIRARLADHPRMADACDEYLARFGDRTVNELKLESLTLHDDPTPLFRAIGDLARRIREPEADAGSTVARPALRQAAHDLMPQALARHPFKRALLSWTRKHARRRIRDRENLRLERTRLFARVRQIFIELGKRLSADAVLAEARDVFYLEIEEILAYADGRSTCTNLRALVALRKDEFCAFEQLPAPPSRFQSRGAVYRSRLAGRQFPEAITSAPGSATGPGPELPVRAEGTGCSAGIVRGIVTIVRDPRTTDIAPGSILVAEHTDPGWILVFPKARGVIVERGSQLSHAAIVARELGIPAIVSLRSATTWLRNGDEVEMDGATGVVRVIAPAVEGVDRSDATVALDHAIEVLAHA